MGLPMAAARLNSALSPKVALPVPNGERMSGESYKATRAPAAMSSVRFPLRRGGSVQLDYRVVGLFRRRYRRGDERRA